MPLVNRIFNVILSVLVLALLGVVFLYENKIKEPQIQKVIESEFVLPHIISPSKSKDYSLWRLANHFPIEVPVVETVLPVVIEPQWTDRLSFVSTVVRDSVERHYFKNNSGEIFYFSKDVQESNLWVFKEEREEYFLFERDEILWMIKK